jgi:hypothetical protein
MLQSASDMETAKISTPTSRSSLFQKGGEMPLKVDIRDPNGEGEEAPEVPEVFQELLTAIQNLFTPEHPTMGFWVLATETDNGQSVRLFTGGICDGEAIPGLTAILNGAFEELRMEDQGIEGFKVDKVSLKRFKEILADLYEAELAEENIQDLPSSTQ